ncbi:MAG TPA: SulP family inorganic anion transporter [Nocardioidaceae bacterium]|nr:SulP family inorganic anion transporter [Nocardioidaceae bacterium]
MRALPEWSLAGYRREWLRPDVIGGLSAGAVVLPQAMAYATIASLPERRPGILVLRVTAPLYTASLRATTKAIACGG